MTSSAPSVLSKTAQKIVHVAFELFGRNGFHAVGLDQIISEAGVSKQTFYNHFESKDDLVLAVLRYRHEIESGIFSGLLTQIGGEDPKARLYAIFDALAGWFEMPEWRGCIFMRAAAEFPARNDPAHLFAKQHARQVQETFQYWAVLSQARDPAALALQLSLLLEGVIALHHLYGDSAIVAEAKRISHSLLDAAYA
jgi:AcrR family transcriptional regulator